MHESKTFTVTDKDNGRKLRLAPGDLLLVRLESPLAGHVWKITRYNKDQVQPLDRPPPERVGKGPPPAVEVQAYYFRAGLPGESELHLEYRPSVDKAAKPARTFKLTVQIAK